MDQKELETLARDIEDLKRAVKRNTPFVAEVFDLKGWDLFSLAAGVLISVFAYGSFDAIPAPWRAGLWSRLANAVVGTGVVKLLIVTRQPLAGGNPLGRYLGSFLNGGAKHIFIPLICLLTALIVGTIQTGLPTLLIPGIAILLGLSCNMLALHYGQPSLFSMGYWGLVTGIASIWWLDTAPFLWIFIIYGGMFFVFAGAIRRRPPAASAKKPEKGNTP